MTTAERREASVKLLFLALFICLTNFRFVTRVGMLLDRDAYPALAAFLAIWLISIAALGIAAFLPHLWMRLFWATPIAASTFLGSTLYHVSGDQLSFYQALLYWSERAYATSVLQSYASWFFWPAVKTMLGVIAIALRPPELGWRVGRLFAAPIVPVLLIMGLLHLEKGKGTMSLPEQFNGLAMAGMLGFYNLSSELDTAREDVSIEVAQRLGIPHVILIVDESVRGDFIDLNVSHGTTPYLASQVSRIANFGFAVSGSNCSIFSHLILRFGGNPQNLGLSLRTGPSIWEYAERAGYHTVYIDGQRTSGRLQNGMTLLERGRIDEFVQFDGVSDPNRDHEIALRLRELVGRELRQFIFVVKAGAHFSYERRYPAASALFTPHMEPSESIGGDRERLINSYKNAVRWTVDGFFRKLLDGLDLSNHVLIYTSDHGQNLMDRGVVLQCNSADPHPFEGLVPLLLLTDDPLLRDRFQSSAEGNVDRATHFEIFPTLLALFGYDLEAIGDRYGMTLLEALPAGERRFAFGPVLVHSPGEIRWKQMPSDLDRLRRMSDQSLARPRSRAVR
jgi:lipid A ethanolaminephosphotransferase